MDRAQQDGGERKSTHCAPYYHIRMFSRLAVYLYSQQMSSGGRGGREFFARDATTAKETGLSVASVIRAREWLVEDGWLVLTLHNRQYGGPNRYAPVSHAEWVRNHPGRCR